MTGKQFLAKHLGSLSAGVFALTVIVLVAIFGGRLDSLSDVQDNNAVDASSAARPGSPPSSSPPSPDDTAPESGNEADFQEQALAEEAAKQEELRARLEEASAPMINTASEAGDATEEPTSGEDQ